MFPRTGRPYRWLRRAERKRAKQDFIGMVNCVSTAASIGVTDAQLYLADLYRSGVGVPRNLGEAAFWLEQAAMRGNLEAMVRLAKLEFVGFVPAKAIFGGNQVSNRHRSKMWAEQAAAAGVMEAKAVLALILEHEGTASQIEILRLLKEGAVAQDPSSCLQLAIKYLKSTIDCQDQGRIAELISLAARKKLPQAVYLLGIIKSLGFGCSKDEDMAHALYEQSARGGFIHGMARHGAELIAGKRHERNLVTGETWLRKAALSGHGMAASMIGALRAGLDGLPPNFHEATMWFQKARILKDPLGAKVEGLLSYLGYGDFSNPEHVLALLHQSRLLATQRSSDPASLFVAEGIPFAFTIKASDWFSSQAKSGDRKAILGLASCMAFGIDGAPDHAGAVRYLRDCPMNSDRYAIGQS